MLTFNVLLKIYGEKKHIYNLFKITNLYQCEIKLQTKIQRTQQHNKSKLKNTYRIKGIIVKGKI